MIRGLEHFSYEERLRVEAVQRRLWRDLIVNSQYFKEAYKKYEDRHFSRARCDRERSNSFNQKEWRFRLDIMK